MIDINTSHFIFMKVGQHANEDFDTIIRRKMKEIEDTGMSFWGYGGPTCHPARQIQPFARRAIERNGSIYLFMEKINSHADPDIIPATMFSVDGVSYQPIPVGINVTGSRYAIVLDEIRPEEIEIPISAYEVGCGVSKGRSANDYIRGHVDKACLEINYNRMLEAQIDQKIKTISYVAKMKDPYAVFVK